MTYAEMKWAERENTRLCNLKRVQIAKDRDVKILDARAYRTTQLGHLRTAWKSDRLTDTAYFRQQDILEKQCYNTVSAAESVWYTQYQTLDTEWFLENKRIEAQWFADSQKNEKSRDRGDAWEKAHQEYFRSREKAQQEYQDSDDEWKAQQNTTKTQTPVDHKAIWYAYNKKFHPNLFCQHPRYIEIEELCKQVNVAYDSRRSDFPQTVATITIKAARIVG